MAFVTDSQSCPGCGYAHDRATSSKGEVQAPSPGDLSLCFKCGFLEIWESSTRRRLPTIDEAIAALHDPQVMRAQHVIATLKHVKN